MSASVIKLHPEIEAAEVRDWIQRWADHYEPRMKYLKAVLDSGKRFGGNDPDLILRILEEVFEAIALLSAGLPEEGKQRLADGCVEWWREWKEVQARAERAVEEMNDGAA
jgi:hypothetical protein